MSSHGDADDQKPEETARETLARLEERVGELLKEVQSLRSEARFAGRRMETLERELDRFVEGEMDPGDLVDRLTDLESRNRDLTERLNEGRAGVERLLARIRFLEEQVT